MATTRLLFLLLAGLLATIIGPRPTNSSLRAPAWGAATVDTSRQLRLDGLWSARPPMLRADSRSRWQATPETGHPPSSNPWAATSRWSAAGELIADPDLWGADGNVLDIARSGNTLYIAGSFRSVGENSGGCVPIDAHTGEPLRPFPKVAGSVYAIVPDGSDGWYIGGEFTAVAGKPRSCLAQVRADGSVSDWNPSVTGSPGYIDPPAVSAILVHGERVFVGGGFREIGGVPHENLGCVDARTGAVLDWNLDTDVGGWVYTLAASDSTVFVGGYFFSVGGQTHSCLAAVDALTGAVRPWQADAGGGVWALLPRGDTLYVGGEFGQIAGGSRPLLAAVDTRTAQLLPFDAHATGVYLDYVPRPRVSDLVLVGDTLYTAGLFTQIGGQVRSSVAALDVMTGAALAWAPDTVGPRYEGFPPPPVVTLAVRGGTLYMGGRFESVGGQSRPFVAALSRETGAVTAWNPRPAGPVDALALKDDAVFVCGEFSLVGEWRHRAGLAAIDLTTGGLKTWNPNPDGTICTAVAVSGARVFVSGNFTTIGGDPQPRSCFAALDTVNGEVTDWNPGANSVATVFRLESDTLYAGGQFTQVGVQVRNHLVAISATTGEVLPWNPNANSVVFDMARHGNTMYVGGIFQKMGDQWRRGLAAVDAATGALTPWNPDTDNSTVEALLVAGNTVYVGGGFNQVGGQPRKALAALDAITGTATAWNPDPTNWDIINPRIRALAVCDSVLYVGGSFASIGGKPRICLAAVDTATGIATSWDPSTDGLVWSLAADGNTVYAGGGFTRAGGIPVAGLAAFAPADPAPPKPSPARLTISQIVPNPTQSIASIRFFLPSSGPADLAVFDIQGRKVASVFHRETRPAGIQEVNIHTEGWPLGLYVCRLEANGRNASRKLMVVK